MLKIRTIMTLIMMLTGLEVLNAGRKHDHNHSNQVVSKSNGKSADSSITDYPTNENTIILLIEGLVCSFCAYATEQQIKKYDFVDKSKFGGDGVEILPEKGLAKIAIFKEKVIPFFQNFLIPQKRQAISLKKYIFIEKVLSKKQKKGLFLTHGYVKQKFFLRVKKKLGLNIIRKSVEVWGNLTEASTKNNLTLMVERWRNIK